MSEELHSTITARAQLDRTFARLVVEETTSAMARSLSGFLDRIEQYDQARAAEHKELMAVIGEGAMTEVLERLARKRVELDDLQAWRATVNQRLAALEARGNGTE